KNIDPFSQTVVTELETTGTAEILDTLLDEIPPGVVQMLDLNGLGPKKARVIWQKMGIDNLGELQYACIENRLVGEKGFGLKTQEKIKQAISQIRAQGTEFHFADVQPHVEAMEKLLLQEFGPDAKVAVTGEVRRKLPLVHGIEFVAEPALYKAIMLLLVRAPGYEILTAGADLLQVTVRDTRILIDYHFKGVNFHLERFRTTGCTRHVEAIPIEENYMYSSEAEIYERADLQSVRPELREGHDELLLAHRGEIPRLIELHDLKGLLHVHTDWSDGLHSIEEMAHAARDMGMEYIGISDHSSAAHYANGLSAERAEAQIAEIDRLNQLLYPFRILKGIEVDILPNGQLDFDEYTLAGFDFVLASVHSHLHMPQDQATARLLRAIRNPYVNILAHPTGRLLLTRSGYEIDHRTVIDACAEHGVCIELNANPHRLDIDWTWIHYAVKQGVLIAINPDAHCKEALHDVRWGVAAARKGMLTPEWTLNAMNLEDIEELFLRKRKQRIA
ncbi:MAG: PHP domain-containing protein, partial [Bacteroidota bacterium]